MPRAVQRLFHSCPQAEAEMDLVPMSPFMDHVWRSHDFRDDASLDDPADRARFIFWFFDTFRHSRAPFDIPVADEVIEWVNKPALDLTTSFSEEPIPGGLRKRPCRRYLTRLMMHFWRHHRRTCDIFSPAGYYDFLTWFAAEASIDWRLPRTAVSDDLVDLLNYPAAGYALPLTVGMYALSTRVSPNRFQSDRDWSREDILAASYEGLSCLLKRGDVRLLPDYVTGFWSSRPFPDVPIESSSETFLTAFEYATARMSESETGVRDTFQGFAHQQEEIRRWFIDLTERAAPGSLLFSGFTIRQTSDEDKQFHSEEPVGHAIAVYRDHQVIAGLSRAAEAAVQALAKAGHKVIDLDYSLSRSRMVQEAGANESSCSIARRQIHLFGLNPEYVPECIACNWGRFGKDDYLIGHFYWELSSVSRIHECGLGLMDEIWVASEYLRELYSRHTDKPVRNMKQAVVPPRIPGRYSRRYFGLPDHTFVFILSFDSASSISRKNPVAAVEAFQKAFPRTVTDVMLIIKTRNSRKFLNEMDRIHWEKVWQAAATDLRIQILDTTLNNDELAALNNVCDVFVSLHRSEGFGFGPAEAMALGKPVVVTNYSGVTDFCTTETAMLVDCREVDVPDKAYPYMDPDRRYRWAEPDTDSAAAAFRTLYDDRSLGRRLGSAGQQLIGTEYSIKALSRRFNNRLLELGFLPASMEASAPAIAGSIK